MNETIGILIGVGGAFLLGNVPLIYLLRGFVGAYLKSKGKVLLMIKLEKGGWCFKAGDFKEDGLIHYKLDKKTMVVTKIPESVINIVRRKLVVCNETDTAPFLFDKIHLSYEDYTNSDGEIIARRELVRRFIGWNDSHLIDNAITLASQKPKIPITTSLGGVSPKALIIGLIIIGAVIFFISQGGIGG